MAEARGRSRHAVGTDPQGAGWLYRLRLDDPAAFDALMDEAAYAAFPK